jgi:hypothetical protein
MTPAKEARMGFDRGRRPGGRPGWKKRNQETRKPPLYLFLLLDKIRPYQHISMLRVTKLVCENEESFVKIYIYQPFFNLQFPRSAKHITLNSSYY